LALAFTVSAQETLQVDVTKLDAQQLQVYQQLKQQQARASSAVTLDNLTPERIDKYAQVGKAFGSAFKECWTTVSTDAEKFGQSEAGKLTMVLIAWKIMGNDAINLVEKSVQYMIGFPLLFIGTIFFIVVIRRQCFPRPNLVSATKVGWFTVKREYKGTTNAQWDGENAAVCCLFYAIFLGICSLIIFVG
jgi:hypothetical protein